MLKAALVLLVFLWSSIAHAEKRVALVIGNSSYLNVPKLPNPKQDAEAMADRFRKAGFDVVDDKANLGADALRRALRDFPDQTRDADVAVVFYAGHGMERNGLVDATLARDIDVEDEAATLDRVIRTIEPARRLQLVIINSCCARRLRDCTHANRGAAVSRAGDGGGLLSTTIRGWRSRSGTRSRMPNLKTYLLETEGSGALHCTASGLIRIGGLDVVNVSLGRHS